MNDKTNEVVMLSPKIIALDSELGHKQNQINNFRSQIAEHEVMRNDHNIKMANHTGYQPQSIYDDAKRGYYAEGKIIGELSGKLQSLQREYDSLKRQRDQLYRELFTRESEKQYEALTIDDLKKQNMQLAKKYAVLSENLNNPRLELIALNKKRADLDGWKVSNARAQDNLLQLQEALELAIAESYITNDKNSLISLRTRINEAKKILKHTEFYLPTETHYKVMAEKEMEFKTELESIEADIKQTKIEFAKNASLIEQIRYNVILNDLLQSLKTMVACDDMTEGQSKIGRNLIEHMQTKGVTKPTANGPCESYVTLSELLVNLDDVKAHIKAEFEADSEWFDL